MDDHDKKIAEHEELLKKIEKDALSYKEQMDEALKSLGIKDDDLKDSLKKEDFSPELWKEMEKKRQEIEHFVEYEMHQIQGVNKKKKGFKELKDSQGWTRI